MENSAEKALKKKKRLAAALAVIIAVIIAVGGVTYALATAASGESGGSASIVVNLSESTGNEYSIIPGTSQTKDPTVKVVFPSVTEEDTSGSTLYYLFLEVTDTTESLVNYEIDRSVWKLLESSGTNSVYYLEITYNMLAASQDGSLTYNVLGGSAVTYSESLKNSDMTEADGSLKDNVKLSFKAYAAQVTQEDENTPAAAWGAVSAEA